jgi:hypothetical protein
MNPMRLRIRLLRRLRQWLPPGLAEKVALAESGAGWSGSPLARLALGTGRRGRLRLRLDHVLAAAIRRQGMEGLPAVRDWGGWQPLGRRRLHFKAVRRKGGRCCCWMRCTNAYGCCGANHRRRG